MPCDHPPDTTMWSLVALRTDSSTTLPTGIIQWINVVFIATIRDNIVTYYGSFHRDLLSNTGTIASHNHTYHKTKVMIGHPTRSTSSLRWPSHVPQSSINMHLTLTLFSSFLVIYNPITKSLFFLNPPHQNEPMNTNITNPFSWLQCFITLYAIPRDTKPLFKTQVKNQNKFQQLQAFDAFFPFPPMSKPKCHFHV